MNLVEKLSNTSSGRETGAEMLRKLYLAINDDDTQAMIASFKADLEKVDRSEGTFVFGRVKAPISASKKFSGDSKYQTAWDRIKDLLAFTIVVDGNNDKVDQIREILVKKYEQLDMKNDYAPNIYEDYMRTCMRKDALSKASYIYQDPAGRWYQTNDGYKNVKLNIMLQGYPVEVQIKTMQQYIAHCSTHDAVYKAPRYLFEGKNDEEQDMQRSFVADKMFPYFEAQAYLRLYKDKLSVDEIRKVREDIRTIYDRNFEIYNKYTPVFNEARADFGVHLYKLLHRKEFFAQTLLSKDSTLMDFSSYETKKVFKYLLKQVKTNEPSLTNDTQILRAVDKLLTMPFNMFQQISEALKGEYRLPGCVLTGAFDGLNPQFINTLQKSNEIFKNVHIKVYGDDFCKALTGKSPIFSLPQRTFLIGGCKYVTSVSEVTDFRSKPIQSLSMEVIDEENKAPFNFVSMTGVMDGCTAGHKKLLDYARSLVGPDGTVYVGIKSDKYVRERKHKEPINNEEDRLRVFSGLRGADRVYITENDILPDEETITKMQEVIANGGKCAIVTGSDWSNPEKLATKPPSSLNELALIKENLPEIELVAAPKRGGKEDFKTADGKEMSSTNLRERLLEEKEDAPTNFIELRELEEQ